MALITKDQNGTNRPLAASAVAVGLGVTQTGKEVEVAGTFVCRTSPDAGGMAIGILAEGGPHGSIWTNAAYDPGNPGKGWKRTMNLVNGNVGIGGSKDPLALNPTERLVVAGSIVATGDVRLEGADCAEEFSVEAADEIDAGTVLVIGDADQLRRCASPYDTRVAGVVSGAGHCKPGIILGRKEACPARKPIALSGTVYCKVDASYGSINIGDLLTTSPTPGHAMKAGDHALAYGAVLGKALRSLEGGPGLI